MTTRAGGVSDRSPRELQPRDPRRRRSRAVAENRRRLRDALGLPAEPAWLEQVHGTVVAVLPAASAGSRRRGRHVHARPGLRGARRRLPAGLPREPHGRSRRHRACGLARARRRRRRGDPCRTRVRAAANSWPGSARRSARGLSKSATTSGTRSWRRTTARRRSSSRARRPLARRPAGTCAAPPRGRGRHRGERRRPLHACRSVALLFLPPRRRDRPHGRARLARLR